MRSIAQGLARILDDALDVFVTSWKVDHCGDTNAGTTQALSGGRDELRPDADCRDIPVRRCGACDEPRRIFRRGHIIQVGEIETGERAARGLDRTHGWVILCRKAVTRALSASTPPAAVARVCSWVGAPP